MFYKINEHKYETIIVNNSFDEECIKDLNRQFERELKREKRLKVKTISLDLLHDKNGFELMDNSYLHVEEDKQKEELYKKINEAITKLTLKQQKIIHLYFWDNHTLREIANILGVSLSTVSEIYYAALKKLRKILKYTRTKQ